MHTAMRLAWNLTIRYERSSSPRYSRPTETTNANPQVILIREFMLHFFRGRRRKTGGVMLLLACMVLGAWGRSRIHMDQFLIQPSQTSEFELDFGGAAFELEYRWETESTHPQSGHARDNSYVTWDTLPNNGSEERQLVLPGFYRIKWETSLGGGHVSLGQGRGIRLPYGTTILILTLLSVYLLLVNPRNTAVDRSAGTMDGSVHL